MDDINEGLKPILDFKISFSYNAKNEKAIKDIRGIIPKGKCIVLCGESGCGKSTILRCLNHLIPEFYEGIFEGFIKIDGEDSVNKTIGEVGNKISSVFQDPRSQFFSLESDIEIAFGLENKGINSNEIKKRVDNAFLKFGLEYLRNREVFKLSSGERQLIAIMAAWAMNSDIILLDEPTANLDYTAIKKLTELLLLLKKEGKTLIINEHRLYYLHDLADEYWLIKNGYICEKYDKDIFLELSQNNLKNIGLRVNDINQIEMHPKKEEFYNQENVLEVKNISFKYGKKRILNDTSFKLNSNEITCIIGQNGAGKTTLGKCLCGLLKPTQGKIYLNGKAMKYDDLYRNSLFIMQESEFQFFTNSVIGELKYGIDSSKYDEIEPLLKEFDMWGLRNRHPFSLSGGQMQKLTLMTAYLSSKKLIILDEPTSGLDKWSMDLCVKLINKMKKEKIVLLISHDLEFIAAVAEQYFKIEDGIIQQTCKLKDIKTLITILDNGSSQHSEIKLKKDKLLDPRVSLFFLSLCMFSIGIDNKILIQTYSLVLLIFSLINKRHKTFSIYLIILCLIYGLEILFPNAATIFMANLLPRYILIFMLFPVILGGRGATNMLACLRKIRVPERLILILSVSFRFFPVLNNDFKLLKQSIKNRKNYEEKNILKKVFLHCEALITSIIFRVIRIAETLSASAETRGISMKNKKTSYIGLKFGVQDYFVMIVLASVSVISIFLK